MVSILDRYKENGALILVGLSSDSKKATSTPGSLKSSNSADGQDILLIDDNQITIPNGSEFREMDTGVIYYYDAESHDWITSGGYK